MQLASGLCVYISVYLTSLLLNNAVATAKCPKTGTVNGRVVCLLAPLVHSPSAGRSPFPWPGCTFKPNLYLLHLHVASTPWHPPTRFPLFFLRVPATNIAESTTGKLNNIIGKNLWLLLSQQIMAGKPKVSARRSRTGSSQDKRATSLEQSCASKTFPPPSRPFIVSLPNELMARVVKFLEDDEQLASVGPDSEAQAIYIVRQTENHLQRLVRCSPLF
jgi:hypothetical protein